MREDTAQEFARDLSEKIIDAYRPKLGLKLKVAEMAKIPFDILRKILSEVKVGVGIKGEIEFFVKYEAGQPMEDVKRAFQLAELLAEETKLKCILFIDEFPSLMELQNGGRAGETLVKRIRTWNEQFKRTALSISGSIRATMNTVAFSSASAFYKQLLIREVKPMEEKYVKEILKKGKIKFTRETISEVSKESGGIPFYVQLIGRELQEEKEANAKTIQGVVKRIIEDQGNVLFKEMVVNLSPKERLVLIGLSESKEKTPIAIANGTKTKFPTVTWALSELQEKGFVEKQEDGTHAIVDPFLEKWLEWKYGNKGEE